MIDRDNEHPWPEEVISAARRFKQGDVIERPPFFYYAQPSHGIWALTRTGADDGPDRELIELDPDDEAAPPYGIITSQTCDIDEQSPKPKQPWIQVAPVYRAEDLLAGGKIRQVERFEVGYLVRLTGPAFSNAPWIADLRISVPLEKSCLVGLQPIPGFGDENGYHRFADHLAKRSGRPALANILSSAVVQSLRQAFRDMRKAEKDNLLSQVEELRLEIYPSRLTPTTARLIVVTHSTPASSGVRSWFDDWWTSAQAGTQAEGVDLLGNRYTTFDDLTVREERRSVELDFRYLSPDE